MDLWRKGGLRGLELIRGSFSVFEAELADIIPICHTTIAGTRIVGRLTAGYAVPKEKS